MSRISTSFEKLKKEGRTALIPYVTAGDPAPGVTVELLHGMVEAGADVIELGVPFSDPMADGPVIQLACERALLHNTRLLDVLAMVAEFREKDADTPIVLMGYLNPIEILGYQTFAEEAKKAGVDGVLTVDLPPEESGEFNQIMRAHDIDTIYLLAPTTEDERIKYICEHGSGYLYYVSVKGVTGSASLDVQAVADKLDLIREYTTVPLGVGFGIKDAESAKAVSAVADGVIVGSVLVNKIAELVKDQQQIAPQVSAIIKDMRVAMDS
ncbi:MULTISPECIES: tryptophan synthase subunit alpha [unclassified Neptuniibacter]|uniref:tryptophan synthase subunit alpha n=1 Tax=unclassified Neptuniibacter TaxID=2630693 RepID=UPI0025D2A298|nr:MULTISPECIES: tryptophan synthase subunit alpha [unclassified Neptuniibacter]|tara:strand:+ start:34395 stop:35198 length:804 start_codon:yes stop_codon:yes gene_type:complete